MTTPIKRALIIRKPWIDFILDGSKTWEMRSQPTKIRGRIALIESGSGMIVGECFLSGCPSPLMPLSFYTDKHRVNDRALLRRWCHPWELENVKKYAQPIPYEHPQGAVIWVNLEALGVTL